MSKAKEEDAVKIFEIARSKKLLPEKLSELVPLSFIGQAAVSFYRQKIKLMDQLNVTEAQRKATLADGQDAGELLLDIEGRIGELAAKERRIPSRDVLDHGGKKIPGQKPSGKPPKHERIGMPEKRMHQAQTIHKHPEVVARVKAKAKENEDIPTKTAVLAEINYQKEKKRRKAAEKKRKPAEAVVPIEQRQYLNALDRCISILPTSPPKTWHEDALREAGAKAKLLIKRLEVFNG